MLSEVILSWLAREITNQLQDIAVIRLLDLEYINICKGFGYDHSQKSVRESVTLLQWIHREGSKSFHLAAFVFRKLELCANIHTFIAVCWRTVVKT